MAKTISLTLTKSIGVRNTLTLIAFVLKTVNLFINVGYFLFPETSNGVEIRVTSASIVKTTMLLFLCIMIYYSLAQT